MFPDCIWSVIFSMCINNQHAYDEIACISKKFKTLLIKYYQPNLYISHSLPCAFNNVGWKELRITCGKLDYLRCMVNLKKLHAAVDNADIAALKVFTKAEEISITSFETIFRGEIRSNAKKIILDFVSVYVPQNKTVDLSEFPNCVDFSLKMRKLAHMNMEKFNINVTSVNRVMKKLLIDTVDMISNLSNLQNLEYLYLYGKVNVDIKNFPQSITHLTLNHVDLKGFNISQLPQLKILELIDIPERNETLIPGILLTKHFHPLETVEITAELNNDFECHTAPINFSKLKSLRKVKIVLFANEEIATLPSSIETLYIIDYGNINWEKFNHFTKFKSLNLALQTKLERFYNTFPPVIAANIANLKIRTNEFVPRDFFQLFRNVKKIELKTLTCPGAYSVVNLPLNVEKLSCYLDILYELPLQNSNIQVLKLVDSCINSLDTKLVTKIPNIQVLIIDDNINNNNLYRIIEFSSLLSQLKMIEFDKYVDNYCKTQLSTLLNVELKFNWK
jgi:hypothetical protein